MRGRIVVSTLRKGPVIVFRPGPILVGEFPVRRINNDASGPLKTVVGAIAGLVVETRQIRFPVRGAANVGANRSWNKVCL